MSPEAAGQGWPITSVPQGRIGYPQDMTARPGREVLQFYGFLVVIALATSFILGWAFGGGAGPAIGAAAVSGALAIAGLVRDGRR
jgi:hypothetical protein